jgi:hypothetical protein
MKTSSILAMAISALPLLTLAQSGDGAQDRGKKVTKNAAQIIKATFDNTGQHPGTAAINGPARIVCLSATSDIPNSQPKPTCLVQAPGYYGNLNPPNGQAGATGAGTVILNCNGTGNYLTCSASIQ